MIFHRLGAINRNQRGFTLIELLSVIAIMAIIVGGITTSVFQFYHVNALSASRMTAVKAVENAVHWIIRDGQQAQTVTAIDPPPDGTGFPLTLTWVESDGTLDMVTYALESGGLQRTHYRNGTPQSQIMVANHINSVSQMTTCQFSNPVLNVKITATAGVTSPASETRLCNIMLRSSP